jgi:2-oxo-hept-3-ene-1,7-dioate hydratase
MAAMSSEDHKIVALKLQQAFDTQQPIALPSAHHPEMTLADGYRVQASWLDLQMASGARRVGYKVGLTSRAMQTALGVDEPQYGHLLDRHVHPDGATISFRQFFKPRLEVELAFVMGGSITGKDRSVAEILAKTAYIQPAIEIVDYRTVSPRPVADMVADNVAGAGAIVGGERIVVTGGVDLRWIGATLSRNGRIEESGVSAAVLGHPALGVAALLDRLAEHGYGLSEGDIVLAGSFTRQVDVALGDLFTADYGPHGQIAFNFA